MATWVCRAGKGGQFAGDFERQGMIAVGWLPRQDLSLLKREEIVALVREEIPAGHLSKVSVPAGVMWRFVHELIDEDTVITPDGLTRELIVGRITGSYEYRPVATIGDDHHYRRVIWEGRYPRDLLPQRFLYSLGSLVTLFRFDGADEALAILRSGGETTLEDKLPTSSALDSGGPVGPIAEDTEARGQELIQHLLTSLDDDQLEELVGGLIRSMGYYTRMAGAGADGGVDVHAARDPLFSVPPFLRVQVKARPKTPMPPQELRALAGVLAPGERGIFVSTGGFTPASRAEFGKTMTLIDTPELQKLYVENYEMVDGAIRALVPLKKVWFPATTE
jgi:restriction system protein